jgi:orotate phosphoribosyltransferase
LHSSRYVQCAKLLSDPNAASKICSSLAEKILKSFPSVDLILSPALGGIIIGHEIGRKLNKEAIFSERVEGKFQLRRGFSIKKDTKVLIVEDVITTGKSILECAKLVKKANAINLGFACIIDRSNKKSLLIKKNKIISQIKISIPVYKKNTLPPFLKRIPATKQGSRFLK